MRSRRRSTAPASAARRCACCACRTTSRPAMLAMLEGAMRELARRRPATARDRRRPGDRRRRARGARSRTSRRMRARRAARRRAAAAAPSARGGTFVAPTLVDLGGIGGLAHSTREVFGPVLHVLRWQRDELPALVDAINATGYGLTHGIHTRIDETVAAILARVAGRQRLRQPQHRRRRRRRAAVRRAPPVGHRSEGRRTALPAAPGARRAGADATAPIALPGPTGESNTLEFHPRGVVAVHRRATSARWSRRRRLRCARQHACCMRPRSDRARARATISATADVVLDRQARSRCGRCRAARRRARSARAASAREFAAARRRDRADRRRRTRWASTTGRGSSSSARVTVNTRGGRRQCRAAVAVRGYGLTPRASRFALRRCATSTPPRFARACRGRGCSRRSTRCCTTTSRRRCARIIRSTFPASRWPRCC